MNRNPRRQSGKPFPGARVDSWMIGERGEGSGQGKSFNAKMPRSKSRFQAAGQLNFQGTWEG